MGYTVYARKTAILHNVKKGIWHLKGLNKLPLTFCFRVGTAGHQHRKSPQPRCWNPLKTNTVPVVEN